MADSLENVSDDLREVIRSLRRFAEAFLERAQVEVGTRAASKYMRDAGKSAARSASPGFNDRTGQGSLRIVSGRLERSLMGGRTDRGAPETISRVQVSQSGVTLEFGSKVPYAAIHEFGGSIPVTESMRGFFWHKWYQTEAEGWKHLALFAEDNSTIRIPKRPYLEPALDDALPEIQRIGEEMFTDMVRDELKA